MGLNRFFNEFLADVRKDKFERTEGGILLRGGLKVEGFYVEGVNGRDWRRHKNLLVDEGILHILSVVFGATAKAAAWYLAPFSGGTTPAANWTAANFASNSSEITSTSEGFTETTRQQASFGTATAGHIDNYAAKAAFTIATSSSLNVTGLGLLTVNTRGGTSGVLASAVKFAVARTLQNGDVWNAGYQIQLTDS